MRMTRTLLLALLAGIALTACDRSEDEAPAAASAEDAAANTLLRYVPADTPYAFGNLSPTPEDITDAYLERAQPTLDAVQEMLTQLKSDVAAEAENDPSAKLGLALLEEFDGKLNREGFESLGFSLNGFNMIYGHGAFPVIRMALSDPAALRAAITRVETKAGMPMPTFDLDGVSYWKFDGGGQPAAAYGAILDDHLVIGVMPTALEIQMLPMLLGQAVPGTSMAQQNRMAEINAARGYLPYGSGYLDLKALSEEFLDANSTTASALAAIPDLNYQPPSPVCVAEYRGLIAKVPMMTAGTTELTEDSVTASYEIDMDPTLSADLVRMVPPMAPASDSDDSLVSLSFGIKAMVLRDILLDGAEKITAAPYACPNLAKLNESAAQAMEQLNRPMPPFAANIRGLRAVIDSVVMENGQPVDALGLLALEVDEPQMLLGMAQMFAPDVAELNITPGGDPVQLPATLTSGVPIDVWAAASETSLGISAGTGKQGDLLPYLNEEARSDGTMLSVEYDPVRMAEIQESVMPDFDAVDMGSPDEAGDTGEADAYADMAESISEASQAMMGRTRLEMRLDTGGLKVESRVTFK